MFQSTRQPKQTLWEKIFGRAPRISSSKNNSSFSRPYRDHVRDYSDTPLVGNSMSHNSRTEGIRKRQPGKKEALPHEVFYVVNGPRLVSIQDLKQALEQMDDEQFNHHTRRENEMNDFSNWIHDVFGDSECAEEVWKAKDKDEARAILEVYFD